MKFAKDMVRIKKELAKLGHKGQLVVGIKPHLDDPDFVENLDGNLEYCRKYNVMRRNFKFIAQNDAVLVLNYRRNNMDGYIGTSALLEMGVSRHLGKKIFLMHKTPDYKKVRWAHEVAIMQPIVINGDLTKIK